MRGDKKREATTKYILRSVLDANCSRDVKAQVYIL